MVGHAPMETFHHHDEERLRAMWHSADLLPALPDGFEVVVAEERPRTVTRDGREMEIEDATLLARRA